MDMNDADIRARGRLIDPLSGGVLLVAGAIVVAALVAACGGGGAVPNHSMPQIGSQYTGPCTGIGGGPGVRVIMPQATLPPKPCPTPWDIAVTDPGNNSVTSYVIGATGNATPLAVLQGSATKLGGDNGIYYDGEQNFFVVNTTTSAVNRWPTGALDSTGGGNLAPDQQLMTALINAPYESAENYLEGLFMGDDVQYIVNAPAPMATPNVTAYQENARTGATTSTLWYAISGNKTGLGNGHGIAVDNDAASPNYGAIYVSNPAAKTVVMFLPSKQFPHPVTGSILNVAPFKTFSGPAITNPIGLDVDKNGWLYVVNNGAPPKILVYKPTNTGLQPPDNTISDGTLVGPYGVAVYTDLRVFVTNKAANSISVFSHGEGPGSVRVQWIIGANTKLNSPGHLALKIFR